MQDLSIDPLLIILSNLNDIRDWFRLLRTCKSIHNKISTSPYVGLLATNKFDSVPNKTIGTLLRYVTVLKSYSKGFYLDAGPRYTMGEPRKVSLKEFCSPIFRINNDAVIHYDWDWVDEDYTPPKQYFAARNGDLLKMIYIMHCGFGNDFKLYWGECSSRPKVYLYSNGKWEGFTK